MSTQRRFSFLVVCILGFYGEIFGQKNTLNGVPFTGQIIIKETIQPFKPKFSGIQFKRIEWCTNGPRFRLLTLPTGSYYPNSLGFICKKEIQLDKITPIAFRFRLGSLDYVNWMEQKPNSPRY